MELKLKMAVVYVRWGWASSALATVTLASANLASADLASAHASALASAALASADLASADSPTPTSPPSPHPHPPSQPINHLSGQAHLHSTLAIMYGIINLKPSMRMSLPALQLATLARDTDSKLVLRVGRPIRNT